MKIRALSIQEPWASAIIHGLHVPFGFFQLFKDIENRSWATDYQGPLIIHASQKFDCNGYEWIQENFAVNMPPQRSYRRGGFIGYVNVFGCTRNSLSRWAEKGYYHWLLKDPQAMPFFPGKGQLRLFKPPTELLTAWNLNHEKKEVKDDINQKDCEIKKKGREKC